MEVDSTVVNGHEQQQFSEVEVDKVVASSNSMEVEELVLDDEGKEHEDAGEAARPACERVYEGAAAVDACVGLMKTTIEADQTFTIVINVDGASRRTVAVAPGDDARERAAVACEGLRHTGWDDCTRSVLERVRQNRSGKEGFVTPLWNELVRGRAGGEVSGTSRGAGRSGATRG